ncbi:hypothetical protein PMAYCL1PPCAC_23525, partial [Pristionchus mayeri]
AERVTSSLPPPLPPPSDHHSFPMDSPSRVRQLPLRYNRLTALPLDECSKPQPLKLLDASSHTLFFHGSKKPFRTLITMDIESELFFPPITLPISEEFGIERFQLLDAVTAVIVIKSIIEYGRRVAVVRASSSRWETIEFVTLINKEWIQKQNLEVLVQFNSPTFYLAETHQDCIPDPSSEGFFLPLHTLYRARLTGEGVDIRSISSASDNNPYQVPFASFLPDSQRILLVSPLFDLVSMGINEERIGTAHLDLGYEGYRLESMSLYVHSLDLVSESFDSRIVDIDLPYIHECTDTMTVEMIGKELVFSLPAASVFYNLDEDTFTKYTIPNSCEEYRVKSVMGGNGLMGVTSGGNVFRGYLKTVPSLLEMTHSAVQSLLNLSRSSGENGKMEESPSVVVLPKDLALSNTNSLIRLLHI